MGVEGNGGGRNCRCFECGTLRAVIREDRVIVRKVEELEFPLDLKVPTKYFRLLVAADLTDTPTEQLLAFARQLIEKGIVYFCAWGPDCERMHDCLDGEVVAAELAGDLSVAPLTTWHEHESLTEATEFFRDLAIPERTYGAESRFWVALALQNEGWAVSMQRTLRGLALNSFVGQPQSSYSEAECVSDSPIQ